MQAIRKCPECGGPLPEDAPEGRCPVCTLKGALELSPALPEVVVTEKPGDHIGRYKLLERIGEGGFGVVYLAEQELPLRRQVALKIVKLGMDTKQVIARFEAERQTLALMDHPNIARVLDAGATDSGRPYFVMELVRGIRITDYCNQHQISTRARLSLFIQVCHAVQHAHQKGVIHRDLKPSNILVSVVDREPTPKIIDFGIAKATQQPLTDKTLFTSVQQLIGTPAYMSPEQAGLGALDIDTRTDIYSLGVLLYELLTGHLPFDTRELARASIDEVRRVIREQQPLRPSTRLSRELAAQRMGNSGQSKTEHQKSKIAADLDWIVMKCLEKDRARRYDTAKGLADDLGRHLNNEPVTAAAPGALYRMRKFVRRHRLGLATATTVVLLLIAGVVGSTWQAVRATRAERDLSQSLKQARDAQRLAEERKGEALAARNVAQAERNVAEAERKKVVEFLEEAERQKTAKESALAREQEQRAVAEASSKAASNERARAEAARDESLKQQAELEALMGFMLGELSDKLIPIGSMDLLSNVTEKALAHYNSLPSENLSDDSAARRAKAFKNLAYILALQGESTAALEAYRRALEFTEALCQRDPDNTNWQAELYLCHQGMGEIWQARGDSARALKEFQQSLEIAQRQTSRFPQETQWLGYTLASLISSGDMQWQQADSRALATYRGALRIIVRLTEMNADNVDWQRVFSIQPSPVGLLLVEERGLDRAIKDCRKSRDIARRNAAQEPGSTRRQADLALSYDNLGDTLLASKDTMSALTNYQAALEIRQKLAMSEPRNTEWQRDLLSSLFKIGHAFSLAGKKPKTVGVFVDSLKAVYDFSIKPVELSRRLFSSNDRDAAALEAFNESRKLAGQLAGKDPGNVQWQEDLARSQSLLGDMRLQLGENERAVQAYREAAATRLQLAQRDTNALYRQYELAFAYAKVAVTLRRLPRPDEALAEARQALDLLAILSSRWPMNFAFFVAPSAGEAKAGNLVALRPDERDDFVAAFQAGFDACKLKVAGNFPDPACRDDWGRYCMEMAVVSLLFDDSKEAASHARTAVKVWQKLSQAAPTNTAYKKQFLNASLALGIFELLNRRPKAAISTSERALTLGDSEVGFRAVLALGCIIDGQSGKARQLLLENRTLEVWPNLTFPEAILDDLHRLEETGLSYLGKEQSEREIQNLIEKK